MTSSEPHKKHTDLKRSSSGQFHRNELAILGTTCEAVKEFVSRVRTFFPTKNIGYADEAHGEPLVTNQSTHSFWHKKQNAIEVHTSLPDNRFQRHFALSHSDWVLVNGNHFEASKQIIICNPEKENSLRKRKEQLTDVVAIILTGNQTELPFYVTELIGERPFLHIDQNEELLSLLATTFLKPAPLKALIMAGGKSLRMGQNKPLIPFNGLPQVLHLAEILRKQGLETWISCREDQRDDFTALGLNCIPDRILNLGPLGGIASAFMSDPESAWLVIASDMPRIDDSMLSEILNARRTEYLATSFVSPFDGMPEPLAAIWEPGIYQQIMQFISFGYSCPRKVLMNTHTQLIAPSTPDKLMNVNTPADLESFHQYHSKS